MFLLMFLKETFTSRMIGLTSRSSPVVCWSRIGYLIGLFGCYPTLNLDVLIKMLFCGLCIFLHFLIFSHEALSAIWRIWILF